MKLYEIIKIVDKIAPLEISEEWDNSGLQVGNPDWYISKIMVALDISEDVINDAISKKADLIITHHPMIFSPLKSIDFKSKTGSLVYKSAKSQISIFSAHTNFDSANGGLNDILCDKIGLTNLTILGKTIETSDGDTFGLGRVGDTSKKLNLEDYADYIIKILKLKDLRYSGNKDTTINKAAVCTGSGGSLINKFIDSDADVFITGDIKYHEAKNIEESGKCLIDIGHFASEHIIIDALKNKLDKELDGNIEIIPCNIEQDPFITMHSKK
ncbi:MAG: Nif3-like dinuclear metal center hexameric protein [Desulfobacterales bacterium]|nr:Nif3-like dinuclear metal center hexameric protein [Desulfobacterales bacterium]